MTPSDLRNATRSNNDCNSHVPERGPVPQRIYVPRVRPAFLLNRAMEHPDISAFASPARSESPPGSSEGSLEAMLQVLLPQASPNPASAGPARPWSPPPMPAASSAPDAAWVETFSARLTALAPAEAKEFFRKEAARLPECTRQRLYPAYAEQLMRLGHFEPAAALCRRTLGGETSKVTDQFAGGVAYHEIAVREHAQVLILESLRARQAAGDTLTRGESAELHDLESGRLRLATSSPFYERYEACLLVMPKPDLADGITA